MFFQNLCCSARSLWVCCCLCFRYQFFSHYLYWDLGNLHRYWYCMEARFQDVCWRIILVIDLLSDGCLVSHSCYGNMALLKELLLLLKERLKNVFFFINMKMFESYPYKFFSTFCILINFKYVTFFLRVRFWHPSLHVLFFYIDNMHNQYKNVTFYISYMHD